MAEGELLARQRQDPAARVSIEEHQVVLWSDHIRRQGHETYDELRADELQTHPDRSAHEHPHHRREHLMNIHFMIIYSLSITSNNHLKIIYTV